MKRPLSDKRPIGPFLESKKVDKPAEVIVYFEMSNIAPMLVEGVEDIASEMVSFDGPATGPHGSSNNAVSIKTRGNQTTHSAMMELMQNIKEETGARVEDVEVVW